MKFQLFIFLLLFINIINCQNCVPDIDYINATCYYGLYGPRMRINRFNMFTEIKYQPEPLGKYLGGAALEVDLDFNTTYKITFNSPACSSPYVLKYSTNTDLMPFVQQPKCLNSYATFDLINYPVKNEISINGLYVTIPYEFLPSSGVQEYIGNRVNGDCKFRFFVKTINNTIFPDFQITHSLCGTPTGNITILNANEYSSITVQQLSDHSTISPSTVIGSSTSASYDNLYQGFYGIALESDQCGRQFFKIEIKTDFPSNQLVLLDDSCPKKAKYQFIVDGDQSYQLYHGGQLVSDIFVKDPLFGNIQVNYDTCGADFVQIDPLQSFPPIHYSITPISSQGEEYCNGIFNVTLFYDSSVVQDIQVSYFGSSNDEWKTIDIENNSFQISNDFSESYIYSITSSCYSQSILISPPSRKPQYTKSLNSTQYSNELVDFSVSNYLDFPFLRLDGGDIIYLPEDGVFRQIPNKAYQLQYIYRDCNTTERYQDFRIGQDGPVNYYYTTTVIKYPNCQNDTLPGFFNYTIYDGFTNQIIFIGQREFYFDDVSPIVFEDYLSYFSVNIVFNFKIPEPEFKVKVLSKAICKYSNFDEFGGLIQIISDYSIEEVAVNDTIRFPASSYYRVHGGAYDLQIYYSSSKCKNGYGAFTMDTEFPNFVIDDYVTPVTDCNENNGALKINDYQKYTTLNISDQDLLQSNGEFNNQASGFYGLKFAIQLGSSSQICSGLTQMFIPTSFDVDIKYSQIFSIGCPSYQYLALSVYSIKDSKGNSYLDNLSPSYFDSLPSSLPSIYSFKSGSCSWNKQISTLHDIKATPVYYSVLDDYYVDSQCIGHARYKVKSDNLFAMQELTSYYKDYKYVSSDQGDLVEIINNYPCDQYLTFKAIQPTIPNINYTIQFNGDVKCLSSYTTINISVIDYQNYISLEYNYVNIDLTTGVIANVRPGYNLVGKLFNFDCPLQTQVIVKRPPSLFGKSVANETCDASLNGEISFESDSKTNQSSYFVRDPENVTYYPVTVQDLLSFGYLGTQGIQILKVDKTRSTCYETESFKPYSNEPKLITSISNDQCETGVLSIISSNLDLIDNIEIELVNGSKSNNTTPAQTLIPSELPMPPLVSSTSMSFSSLSLSSQSATFTNLTKGNYTVIYQINQENCRRKLISPVSIQVEKCQTINNDKDDKLGLKIGLPIGLFFLVVIAGAVIYLFKKKLQKSKSKGVKMTSFR